MKALKIIGFLIVILLPVKSLAAPAYVQKISNGFPTSTFTTWAYDVFPAPVTGGNMIVCLYRELGYTAGSITSVTDNMGNTYSRAGTQVVGTGVQAGWYFDVWYAVNVKGGPNLQPQFTFSQSQTADPSLLCAEYSGVSSLDQVSSGVVTSDAGKNVTFTSLTTTAANELVLGYAAWDGTGGVTPTVGTGFTLRDSSALEDKISTSAGSVTGSIKLNSAGVQTVYWFLSFKQSPGTGAFTHVQSNQNERTTSGTNVTVTLPSNPTAGNLVACFFSSYSTNTNLSSFKDSNNNNYTMSPSSPVLQSGMKSWGYYLIAPSNASKTITVTMAASMTWMGVWCSEFSATGGRIVFDKDAAAGNTASPGLISAPSITPSSTRELLYAGCQDSTGIVSVEAPWIEVGNGLSGNTAAYVIGASSPTPLNFPNQPADASSCVSMAFRTVVSGFPISQ